jgi:osmoprotectant transport system substrate-binding protein
VILSRARALALIGSAVALARCGSGGAAIRIGSKNFTESIVIAEIYSRALENAGLKVERHLNLGSTAIAMAAIQRGDIDLYPEYTGTGLIDVLHLAPMSDPKKIYATVAAAYAKQYHLTWLEPSPMNDSQALATTKAISKAHNLTTLSELAKAAPQFRLATIQEFLARADGLPGLQKFYGGFDFKAVRTYDITLKYQALHEGDADIASAFSTDGAISTDDLVVLRDDRNFWPAYNVAPVVREEALAREPRIATVLNALAPAITDRAAARMNAAVEGGKQDPSDVADAFLDSLAAISPAPGATK